MKSLVVWIVAYYVISYFIAISKSSLTFEMLSKVMFWICFGGYYRKRISVKASKLRCLLIVHMKKCGWEMILLLIISICSIAPILLYGELKWENIKIITVCYNLVVATSAALIEELIFRETLITWIHKELQISEYKTVFFSSVLFAVAHLFNLIGSNMIDYTLLQSWNAFCIGINFWCSFYL